MPAIRKVSARLSSLASPYNVGVTLFKLEEDEVKMDVDLGALPSTPQREKRAARTAKKEEDAGNDLSTLLTIDDDDFKPLLSTPPRKRARTSSSPSKSPRAKQRVSPGSKPAAKRKASGYKRPLATSDPTPARWREVFDALREMRKHGGAPVDTMGCHMAQRHETDPRNKRFTTLVSLILSAQTNDKAVDTAVINLRQAIGGTLSVEALLAADSGLIKDTIRSIGMSEKKTNYLKTTAQQLCDDFNGDVPQSIEGMLSLHGVGPKIGFLALHNTWDINAGIGVDTHVARITRLLGWHNKEKEEDARISLESWLPKEHWREINPLLVGFGQTICEAKHPRCEVCSLSSGLCPSARIGKTPMAGKGKRATKGGKPKRRTPTDDSDLDW
ncbi:ENDO3c domain-containing protein [Mycena indigotica]|uniref:Endonuclease III homolog n=1 Tax=Mycena indigotica TaxID=2126181 RepID=A0A8H6VUM0_9AGAR|nr:ENDO3c domain-containing protein [Mycena indigotica]KAF7294539.1 ENDO3c domain-containing protein [Mycena indigotica]